MKSLRFEFLIDFFEPFFRFAIKKHPFYAYIHLYFLIENNKPFHVIKNEFLSVVYYIPNHFTFSNRDFLPSLAVLLSKTSIPYIQFVHTSKPPFLI